MKKIKILILIFILLILLLSGIYIYISYIEKMELINIKNEGDIGEEISYDTSKIEKVKDASNFFSVEKCVQQYLDEFNNNNDKYFAFDENNEYNRVEDEETINKNRIDLLSSKFIESNSITINNLTSKLETFNEKVVFDALKMRYIRGEKVENYIVYGIISSIDKEYLKDSYIIVNVDRTERTFSIEPVNASSDYESIDEIKLEYDDTEIQRNDINEYIYKQMTYEDIIKEYFYTFKRIIQVKSDLIYNYLQEDYRLQRFGTLEDYKNYVQSNLEEIAGAQIQKYSVNNYENHTEFVCMDQYQNLYIFDETEPMEFTLQLDSYTIISDTFKETYDSKNEQYKVSMNIDKWVNMLNNRDYAHAYKVLDETFRNNNWDSEQDFEQYMRDNLPLHYDVEYKTYSTVNGTYIQQINLTDITEKTEETISLNIIMKLSDNYNFAMSFEIIE